MRAVIYTRVSNDDSGRSRSTDDQERECRQLCEQRGWPIAHVLCDNDIGASRWSSKDRPAYRQLAEILEPGDILVTWEASRAQRDLEAYVQLRTLCADRGVQWCYSGRVYDMSAGDDRFTTGLDALLAEKEAEQIRDRVLRGKRASAMAGRPAGRPPYGYRPVRDLATGRTLTWEPDPERAPIVQEIVKRILSGDTIHAVCRDLNSRGVLNGSGRPWVRQNMRAMLESASYAGLRTHQGAVIGEASWPALITVDDHRALQTLFRDPTRRVCDDTAAKHLLSGIARCGVCGSPVRWFGPKSEAPKPPGYLCAKSSCVRRRAAYVDTLVTEALLSYLETVNPAVFNRDDPAAAAAREEARALRARLEAFTDQAADGGLSPSALARIEARLLPQIAAAERRAGRVPVPLLGQLVGPEARVVWETLSISDRRAAIRAAATVTIHKSSVGTRRFNPADIVIEWRV